MSSNGSKNEPESSTKQIALPATAGISSKKSNYDVDLLNQATGSQGLPIPEPPKPAKRQRTQARSVQVIRSSSASGGILFNEQKVVSQQQLQRQQQQVLMSGGHQRQPYELQRTTRPLSIDPSNFPITNITAHHQQSSSSANRQGEIETSSRFVEALGWQQIAAGSSAQQRLLSTSSVAESGASISTSLGPSSASRQRSSASRQLAATGSATESQSSSTTTRRIVASGTVSSSTNISSGSISGQTISLEEGDKATVPEPSSASRLTTGFTGSTITGSQRTVANRTISTSTSTSTSSTATSSDTFGFSSLVGGSVGGTSIGFDGKQRSVSSLVKSESIKLAAASKVSHQLAFAETTSSASLGQHTRAPISTSGTISSQVFRKSTSSGAPLPTAATSAGPTSSLVGPSSVPRTHDSVATDGSGQVTLSGQRVDTDTGGLRSSETLASSAKIATHRISSSRVSADGGTLVTSGTPSPISKATWTTSAVERQIASKYLDKSFRSMSPSVGAGLLAESHKLSGGDDDEDEQAQDRETIKTIREEQREVSRNKPETSPQTAIVPPMVPNISTMTTGSIIVASPPLENINYPPKSRGQVVVESKGLKLTTTTTTTTIADSELGSGQKCETISAATGNIGVPSESISETTTAVEQNKPIEQMTYLKLSAAAVGGSADAGASAADTLDAAAAAGTLAQGAAAPSKEIGSEPSKAFAAGEPISPLINLELEAPNADDRRRNDSTVVSGRTGNHNVDQSSTSTFNEVNLIRGSAAAGWGSDSSDDKVTIPIISATTNPNVNYRAISASSHSKGTNYLPLPTEMPQQPPAAAAAAPQRPYPKKVFFIIVNEFCERFSYYGLRTVLVLYLRGVLDFTDANSTIAFHLFTALCYLTPVMGAILGDSIWGKFKTILYLSILYFFGELILVLSSIFWNNGQFSIGATILGLTLIGFGTGGIKPCVSALGGDQFYPHETNWRQTFFSVFYGAINLGALVSMFVTPLLRSNFQCVNRTDCFPYAFGLPCALMLIAIIIFTVAKNRYYLVPLPEKNILVAFCQCVWLALRRKLSGHRLPEGSINLPINPSHRSYADTSYNDTSSSNLSVSSNEGTTPVSKKGTKVFNLKKFPPPSEQFELSAERMLSYQNGAAGGGGGKLALNDGTHSGHLQSPTEQVMDRNHWLYLASDQFNTRSIEDFRSVLGALFLMLPMPIYWSLFDQQSSLWTLQATRMDGRISIWGTNFILEPDQMSVLNPLLLLLSIAVFQMIIYPSLARCNVMQSSVQKITVGGLFLALAFVASAFIELKIQQNLPPIVPQTGQASLLLVNGLSDCSMNNCTLSYVKPPSNESSSSASTPAETSAARNSAEKLVAMWEPLMFNQLEPLGSKGLTILSSTNQTGPIEHYQIAFKLTDGHMVPVQWNKSNNISSGQPQPQQPSATKMDTMMTLCPFSQTMEHQLSVGPLHDKAVKLLYLEQGNGKLAYRIFDDSLDLPASGKARVRLLYEFFGSATLAHTHQFYLDRASLQPINEISGPKIIKPANLKFHTTTREGQVLLSQFMDVDVSAKGDLMLLRTDDKLIGNNSTSHQIALEAGTRNLIIVHQNNASNVDVKHQVLQDNQYRVSMLYQLIPYLLLSISEVLFSITSLEFSYSMAPKNMKTILMAAFCLTTSVGNLLTVAIESIHPFSSLVADFFFYAFIMVLAMIVFAIMGYYHTPRRLRED